jgi:hypothetical protein
MKQTQSIMHYTCFHEITNSIQRSLSWEAYGKLKLVKELP